VATSYPGSLDSWSNPTSTTAMNNASFYHDELHSNHNDAIEAIEGELGTNPSGSYATVKARLDNTDTTLASSFTRSPVLTVASVELPADQRAKADYECDGVNDQVQINAALAKASRIADGFSTGEGWIGVQLIGPTFTVGNNDQPITIYPNTHLKGAGLGTLIKSEFSSTYTGGVIEAVNANVHRCKISELSIGSPNYTHVNGHGIKLVVNDTGSAYEMKSGSDNFNMISRVNMFLMKGRGIWLQGGRASIIDNIHAQNCIGAGIYLDGHSDTKIHRVLVNGIDGEEPGVWLPQAGNTQISDTKVAYRGNKAGGSAQHGFQIATSRVMLSNVQAQDCGGWGFYLTGSDVCVANAYADSNSAQSSTMGGFYIGAQGSFTGLTAIDRNQTPTSPQLRGIQFNASPQVYLSGRVEVPSGTNHVVNAAGSNSYVRVVRGGTTIYSQG
jgi:hypothetical protein